MSAIFGKRPDPKKPAATGLTIQTSSNAVPVPVCWGQGKMAPNIIWYDGFKATKTKAQGGKGGRTPKIYTYSADMILALCEGPCDIDDGAIKAVWQNGNAKSLFSKFITQNSATEFEGSYSQTPWSYLTTKYPAAALAYRGVCYIGIINYQLGDQPNVPQHNFEIRALLYQTGVGGTVPDADPALLVQDFLCNENYGTPFPPTSLDLVSLLSGPDAPTTGDNHYQTYCRAMGFSLSPFLYETKAANETLEHWLNITNTSCVWSGSLLKFIPYGDEEITANGVTFKPDNVVRAELNDSHFQYEEGEDPVQVERGDPADAKNSFYVEIEDREAGYELKPIPARDQASIEAYGLKQADTITAHEIKSDEMGAKVAHLALQRSAYVRNTYRFVLPSTFVYLEAMDIVTLTQATLSMVDFAVRITEITEDDDGLLQVVAEDFTASVSSVSTVATQPTDGTPLNSAVDPGDITEYEIIEVPADLTNGVPQIWLAATGDPANYWGGCEVWISTDDASYFQIGSIDNSCRIGVLSANLPAYPGANPDVTNTMEADFTGSESEFESVSPLEAAAYATLMYVGGEYLAYETVTLASQYEYEFDTLYRKLYGSLASLHLVGAKVTRLDDEVFKFNLPEDYIGELLYVKFLSYNQWGSETQTLADVSPVTFTPTGIAWTLAPPTSVTITPQPTALPDGSTSIALKIDWVASPATLIDRYEIDVEVNGSGNWVPAPSASAGATTTTFATSVLASTNYRARVRAVRTSGYQVNSTYAISSSTSSGGTASAPPNAPTGLVASPGASSAFLSWVAPVAGAVVSTYKIYAVNNHSGAFGTATLVGTVSGSTRNFLHGGLASGSLWRYWVVASNSAGDSSPNGPADITVTSLAALTVQQAGSPILTNVSTLNFQSGAVVTTPGAGVVDVAISGGGGGGGGGATGYFNGAVGDVLAGSGSAFAAKGTIFVPNQTVTVTGVWALIDASASAQAHFAQIATCTSPTVGTIGTLLGTSSTVNTTTANMMQMFFPFATPVTLTIGQTYWIGVVNASGVGTTICAVGTSTSTTNAWQMDAPGFTHAQQHFFNTVGVTNGQTTSLSQVGTVNIWIEGYLTMPGGSAVRSFSGYSNAANTVKTSASATAGTAWTPAEDIWVTAVQFFIDAAASGQGHFCQISTVNTSTNAIIAVVATTATVVSTTADPVLYRFPFATPVKLTAGTPYMITGTNASGIGTTVFRGQYIINTGITPQMNAPGFWQLVSGGPRTAEYATVGVTNGQAATGSPNNAMYGIGLEGYAAAIIGASSPFWASQPAVPALATFTMLKDAGTTGAISQTSRGLLMSMTYGGSAVVNNMLAYQATPGALWTATALIQSNQPWVNFNSVGIGVRDNATGRIQNFGIFCNSAGTLPHLVINRWSAIDTFVSNDVNTPWAGIQPNPIWVRVILTATDLELWLSVDGENFTLVSSIGKNSYVASIDQVGVFWSSNPNSTPNSVATSIHIMSWTVQ